MTLDVKFRAPKVAPCFYFLFVNMYVFDRSAKFQVTTSSRLGVTICFRSAASVFVVIDHVQVCGAARMRQILFAQ